MRPPTSAQHKNTVAPTAQVAIIIDDLGYQWRNGLRSIQLQGDYTLAILPFSPFSSKLAEQAKLSGKEIMLHAPMEPVSHHSWAKHKGLDSSMNQEQVLSTLDQMLKDVPFAKGINNHMGSALTQNGDIMNWLMEDIATRGMYFIDSVTTSQSLAYTTARKHNIPSLKRDVFIDNIRSQEAIEAQFIKLLNMAKKHGTAVGICHPYPETIAFLEDAHVKIKENNIRLVPINALLSLKHGGHSSLKRNSSRLESQAIPDHSEEKQPQTALQNPL